MKFMILGKGGIRMALYVKVFINKDMIISKACQRMTEPDKNGVSQYRTDCNRIIEHKPKEGAAVLAQKLLSLAKVDAK